MNAQKTSQADRNKMAVLVKLSLHFWKPELTDDQQKQRWDDYLEDLGSLSVYDVQQACAAWRQSDANHFPTPGQLIAKADERRAASVAKARAEMPAWRAPGITENLKPAWECRPWREILVENGRRLPANDSVLAQTLDRMRTPLKSD